MLLDRVGTTGSPASIASTCNLTNSLENLGRRTLFLSSSSENSVVNWCSLSSLNALSDSCLLSEGKSKFARHHSLMNVFLVWSYFDLEMRYFSAMIYTGMCYRHWNVLPGIKIINSDFIVCPTRGQIGFFLVGSDLQIGFGWVYALSSAKYRGHGRFSRSVRHRCFRNFCHYRNTVDVFRPRVQGIEILMMTVHSIRPFFELIHFPLFHFFDVFFRQRRRALRR